MDWLRIVAILGVLAFGTACKAAEVALGINYSWWRLSPLHPTNCAEHPADVFAGAGFLPQYQNDEVRKAVQDQLRSMHQAGFTSIRTRIAYKHPFNDRGEGYFTSTDGTLAKRDQDNVRDFIKDIVDAGFGTIEVTYGFGGRQDAGLYCRHVVWGDCFDPGRTDENWKFIADTTQIVKSAAGKSTLRFDLSTEGCPAPNMPAATLLNAKSYLQTIASRFQARFGDGWLISCAHSRRSVRMGLLLKDLTEIGLTPKYLEIHNYQVDNQSLEDALDSADSMADRTGAQLILGEMRYHSPEQTSIVRDWLRRNPESRLIALIQWPLAAPSTKCPVDTPPPYTPGPLLGIH